MLELGHMLYSHHKPPDKVLAVPPIEFLDRRTAVTGLALEIRLY